MLQPKRTKWRKHHRGRMRGVSHRGSTLSFGQFGLMAMEPHWITGNQIESSRITIMRKVRRGGKLWIRVFPTKTYTKKPQEVRMGSGKGAPEGWVAVVKPGKIIFELDGVNRNLAKEALRLAGHKLPIRTRFVER